jgi:hypothetical protein
MKWRFTAVLFIMTIQLAFCHQNADSTKIKYSLGVTPSAILNLVPAVQLSHELYISRRWSLGLETGYIFSHSNGNNENTKGYRIRPELKLRVLNDKFLDLDLLMFYTYRYYQATRVAEIVKGNSAYIEEIQGIRKTTLSGGGLGLDFGMVYENSIIKKVNVGFAMGLGNISNQYSDEIIEPQPNFFLTSSAAGNLDIPILILNVSLYFL